MGPTTIESSQLKAARVVGGSYLIALATSVFAEFYVRGSLIVANDAAQTAHNILTHEALFRLGIAASLTTYTVDVVLIAALYVVLKPVAPHLALGALIWRLVETASLGITALDDLDVLRVLSGAEYLQAMDARHLDVLARLSTVAHADALRLGLFFFGFGSTLFCYLWLKSGYIPRWLAGLGVFGSALVGICAYLFILFPGLIPIAAPGCYAPIFFFELIVGVWLLVKGLRPAPAANGSVRAEEGVSL